MDVDEFFCKMEEGARKELQGDLKEALGVYGEAESLYGGDFLAEELYSPWVTAKREEIHRKYLDILSKMAHLYEKQGRFKKAIVYNKKLIQADPSLEAAYRSLMILYANRGLRAEALRTYEACCKALHRYPKAIAGVYFSLATPFLEIIDAPNFVVDWAYGNSKGKTTVLRVAGSCWGNPDERSPAAFVNQVTKQCYRIEIYLAKRFRLKPGLFTSSLAFI